MTPMNRDFIRENGKFYTFCFEFISPENKIVLEYDKTDIVLHGVIETKIGIHFSYNQLCYYAKSMGLSYAHNFGSDKITLEQVQEYINNSTIKDGMIEGVVVKFRSDKMLKFKTEDYVKAHREWSKYVSLFKDFNTAKLTKNGAKILIDAYVNNTLDDILGMQYIDKTKLRYNIEVFKNWTINFNLVKSTLGQPTKEKRHEVFCSWGIDTNDKPVPFNISAWAKDVPLAEYLYKRWLINN